MVTTPSAMPVQAGFKSRKGIELQPLIEGIEALTKEVVAKIDEIRRKGGEGGGKEVCIGDMFDLQMTMNKLQQHSEMSTSILSAINGSINSMARNLKG